MTLRANHTHAVSVRAQRNPENMKHAFANAPSMARTRTHTEIRWKVFECYRRGKERLRSPALYLAAVQLANGEPLVTLATTTESKHRTCVRSAPVTTTRDIHSEYELKAISPGLEISAQLREQRSVI